MGYFFGGDSLRDQYRYAMREGAKERDRQLRLSESKRKTAKRHRQEAEARRRAAKKRK